MHWSVVVAMVFLSSVGCNDNDFSGSSARRSDDASRDEPAGPELGTKQDGKRPKKKPKDDADEPNEEPLNTGEDLNNGPSIVDLINALLGSGGSNVNPNQPDEDTIDFGGNEFFHIGDGEMSDSTCRSELALASLAGTQFYFEFEVLRSGTDVDLEILRVCGIDYADSNTVRILRGGASAGEVARKTVNIGDSVIRVSGRDLAAGSYLVVVEASPNAAYQGDRDDYLVGSVKLEATKPIRAGAVGAR